MIFWIKGWWLRRKIIKMGRRRNALADKKSFLQRQISNINIDLFQTIAGKGGNSVESRAIKVRLKLNMTEMIAVERELAMATTLTNLYLKDLKDLKLKTKT